MRLPGQVGQVFAQRNSGDAGGDGAKRPRYSARAFGFMSQVSICDAPPLSQIMMVDLAARRPGRSEAVVAEAAGQG